MERIIKLRKKTYKIVVEPSPYKEITGDPLVWTAFKEGVYGWEEMHSFTRAEVRAFPITLALEAHRFIKECQTTKEAAQ